MGTDHLRLTAQEQEMALAKVITWTYEPKSAEVRRQSQAALVALFQLNASHFTRVLHNLPKILQENASGFVAATTMNESTATLTPERESTDGQDILMTSSMTSSMVMTPMKPRQSPGQQQQQPLNRKSPFGRTSSSGVSSGGVGGGGGAAYDPSIDDSENLNPEDIHKSLRSTANAIQNYTFDSANAAASASGAAAAANGSGSSDTVHKQNIENLAS